MMVNSAQPGEDGEVHALSLSLYISTMKSKVVGYAQAAERADTLLVFLLYPFLHCVPHQ